MAQQSTNMALRFPDLRTKTIAFNFIGKYPKDKLKQIRNSEKYGNHVKIEQLIAVGETYRENIQFILDTKSLKPGDEHDENFKSYLRRFVGFEPFHTPDKEMFNYVSVNMNGGASDLLNIYCDVAEALEPIVRSLD